MDALSVYDIRTLPLSVPSISQSMAREKWHERRFLLLKDRRCPDLGHSTCIT